MEDDKKGKFVEELRVRKSNLGPIDVDELSPQEDTSEPMEKTMMLQHVIKQVAGDPNKFTLENRLKATTTEVKMIE